MRDRSLEERARRHSALGDPVRLGLVEDLLSSDRTSLELQERAGLASNSLAYHLEVLEQAGLITRCQSSGDRRRRYICLVPSALPEPLTRAVAEPRSALFVCTQNSARSPLAAALWRQITAKPATSAGTHPADRIHRGALAAGRRAAVDLSEARPQHLEDIDALPELVVTVCDRAHEELDPHPDWLHWSLPDPVEAGTRDAFDATVEELRDRITNLADTTA
ncbi:MAG TPA: helix-turn-helix domain-containing protein [Acidimicrobiia bacterium]|nr:helix-turn-helix domain-containing protein [Acidimicrobiia bacterium]